MTLRWMVILVLIVTLGIVYLAYLNAVPVKVVLPLLGVFNPTSGLLMIFSFFIGIVCTLILFAIRDWQDYFRGLADDKREKMAQVAREKLSRARNYLCIGLDDLAMANIKDALEKDPQLAGAHVLVGELIGDKGDHYGAIASHNQALGLDRDNDAIRWKLSQDYQKVGNTALALKVLREGLDRDEKNIYLLIRHRDLLMEIKDWEGAINAQTRLSKIKEYKALEDFRHFLAGLYFEKGKGFMEAGETDEAVKAFEEATKLDQQLSLAYVRMGDALIAQQKDKNALKIWALGWRRTSDQAILTRLEEYYLGHGDPSRIINLYLRYIEEKPQDPMLRFQFANLLFKLEMLEETRNQIEEVRRLQRDETPRVAYLSYRLKEKMEDTRGAMDDLKFLVEDCVSGSNDHVCSACGKKLHGPMDRCPACGRWGSLRKTV